MSSVKTHVSDASVEDFINSVPDETKRADSFRLLQMYTDITGEPARMWGDSMIGFGQYHYKSERSTQEGDWPRAAFSPRKQNLTLYVMPGFQNYGDLLAKLGKHKVSVGCLYINKLADVDTHFLEAIIRRSFDDMETSYPSKK
jgi:hypothetical protein